MSTPLPGVPAVGDIGKADWAARVANWITSAGSWGVWTPAITGATTNPNLGSGGKALGRYTQINDLVIAQLLLVFGTSGTSQGSGFYSYSMPLTPDDGLGSAGDPGTNVGNGLVCANGLMTPVTVEVSPSSSAVFAHYVSAAVNGNLLTVGSGQPGNFGANDYIRLNLAYKAA